MIYLYGAGGHAKVIADILELNSMKIGGYFDDDPKQKIWDYKRYGFPGPFNEESDELIISIGNNSTRKKIANKLSVKYHTAIHPGAIISPHAIINEGTAIMGAAIINSDSVIGKHCIINTSASIDHDCVIKDFVHISPNATLCGNVLINKGTHVGAGAIIIQGKSIGANCVIGAGSVVLSDLPDNVVAVGNPAKVIKLNNKNFLQ